MSVIFHSFVVVEYKHRDKDIEHTDRETTKGYLHVLTFGTGIWQKTETKDKEGRAELEGKEMMLKGKRATKNIFFRSIRTIIRQEQVLSRNLGGCGADSKGGRYGKRGVGRGRGCQNAK
jgi:hypothetical protein